MTERVSQNNFPAPEVIKLKTTSKLFGTDTLLTKDLLKINFIFQMLSIEKHGNVPIGLKTTGSEVMDHTGNYDKPCNTDMDRPCSEDKHVRKLQTFYHEQTLCNPGNLSSAFFLYISVVFYMVVNFFKVFQSPKSTFLIMFGIQKSF